jgi:2-oxoglutarate dehydrogenase E2 component (dihydrolipoamide succinyltransferase)
MAQFDLLMPKMGESVAEATIIKWVKNIGDTVKLDETVLEIATDKVDSEIPSPFEGTLVKQLFKEGDVVQVGTVIAVVSSDASVSASPQQTSTPAHAAAAPVSNSVTSVKTTDAPIESYSNSTKFFSPLVNSIAKQEGIAVAEL